MLALHPQPLIRAHFRRLIWIDNVAQNSYRAQQYRELRRRIRQQTTPVNGRRVMLHRGHSGVHRVLVNEEELEDMLAKRGFEIVDPAKLNAREVAQACAGARIALCVEGAQLTHAFLAMAERGAIVAMIPPYRYINHYKDLTDCISTMRYGSITGTAVAGGFRIDPGELLRLIDRVESALDSGTPS
jgi:capsular polysaccharide biosynthesis protein